VEKGSITPHKRRNGRSGHEDGSEVIVGMLGVHCTEKGLARRHQPILDVIIGVLIGTRFVRRSNVCQSAGGL
jgi:hypothetical protein